jgi:hypothetical protein
MLKGKLLKKLRKTIRKSIPISNELGNYIKNIFEKSGTELERYKRVKTTSAIWIIMNTEKPNLTQVSQNG